MKDRFSKIFLATILGIVIMSACDAPRNNPLDPLNPNKKLSKLSGFVFTKSAPPSPIANATVLWQPTGRIVQTNSAGEFDFEDIAPGAGWLFVNKNEFSPDSIHMEISEKEQQSQQFFLNAEPVLVSASMSSEVRNRYPATQSTSLEITIAVNDSDNDIDSVFISNEKLGIHKALEYNPGTRQYGKSFSPYLLGITNFEQVIGHNFEISVKDFSGRFFIIGSTQLDRIIHEEIQFSRPANSQTITRPFDLAWNLFEPGFEFYYNIEIWTDEFFYQELVWEKTQISSDYNSIAVEADLPVGNYFWVIWCVDEFGNRSRSKPATFTLLGN